jgi:RNA polymerase sigma-70 factor (ECF subfamily)
MVKRTVIDHARDEATVVADAKAGSYEAFEELVNRYERKTYPLGHNVTGSHEDAEDVLQETFLKAFEHLADFREDSRFYTWIFRLALNIGLMKLRKRRSDKAVPLEGAGSEQEEFIPREFTDWRPNPEQRLAESELQDILLRAAQSLPPSFRTVFLLRDVEGFSTEETARALHLTEGTVKAFLHRARLQLRERLSQSFRQGSRERLAGNYSGSYPNACTGENYA